MAHQSNLTEDSNWIVKTNEHPVFATAIIRRYNEYCWNVSAL